MSRKMNEVMGLILARGGSKGIPQKNIKILAGKPMIAWTIEAARLSKCISRIIISTDDDQIAEIAKRFGGDVPFKRPDEFARDDSSSIDAVIHAIRWLEENENYIPEYIMLLQPTSPLRSVDDIQNAVRLMRESHSDSLVSVVPVEHHPFWTYLIKPDGCLDHFITTDPSHNRRQDLPDVYAVNGSIYIAGRDALLENQSFFSENTQAYIMPQERSLDIDTNWDFYLADLILKDKTIHESN
jgi:CMP-N-acetylneuraminic acid synthetase